MIKASLLCAALCMSFANGALGAETGFYVAGGAGKSWQHVGRSDGIVVSNFPFDGVISVRPTSTDVDGRNLAWNAALGYRVNPYFAAEVSYLHYGSADVTETYQLPLGGAPITLIRRYSSQIQGPALSLLGRLPIGERFTLFARGGAFFADERIKQDDPAGDSITLGQRLWLAGAGAEWSLTPSWALRLEYAQSGRLNGDSITGRTDVRHLALNAVYGW